ncbi:MAG: hypothetical protein AB7P76_11640 [Candidatus Melainabacteria bacterium]
MIRIVSNTLETTGSIFALLSPITICHWLAKSSGMTKFFQAASDALDLFFTPLNMIVSAALSPIPGVMVAGHLWSLSGTVHFGDTDISLVQGILGIIFAVIFIACNTAAKAVLATGQRVQVSREMVDRKMHQMKLESIKQQNQNKARLDQRVVVFVRYEFSANPNGANIFENLFRRYNGHVMDINSDSLTLDFANLDQALKYCKEAANTVNDYYATLRPMDPKPPFRMGVFTPNMNGKVDPLRLMRLGDQVARYAQENHVIVTQGVFQLLEALHQTGLHVTYPIGLYDLEGGKQYLYELKMK